MSGPSAVSRRACGACVGAVLLALASTALADGMPQRVYVSFTDCDPEPFSYDELESALRLELGHAGVRQVARGAPPVVADGEAHLALFFPCAVDGSTAALILRARDEQTSQSLDLSDLPADVRTRGIALAVTEIVSSAWPTLVGDEPQASPSDTTPESGPDATSSVASFETQANPSPAAEPTPATEDREVGERTEAVPTAPMEPSPASGSHVRSPMPLEVGAATQARIFTAQATMLWGGRPSVSWRRLEAGFDLLFGRHHDDIARLDSRLLAGSIAFRVGGWQRGRWRGWVALRSSLGTIAVRTTASDAEVTTSNVRELYVDVATPTGAAYTWGSCSAKTDLEAGYARGFIAKSPSRDVAAFGGLLASARLGVGCTLTQRAARRGTESSSSSR